MYTYFFLTSTRCRRRVLRVAPLITSMQIAQFAWGTVVNVYAALLWANRAHGWGCSIHPNILLIGASMYVAYGALFVRLFMHRYVQTSSLPHRTARGDGDMLPRFQKNGKGGSDSMRAEDGEYDRDEMSIKTV